MWTTIDLFIALKSNMPIIESLQIKQLTSETLFIKSGKSN